MLAKTIPLVMVGVGDEKLPAAYLQCDNASGMRQIVDHLVEVHHINDMAFVGGVNGGACARGTDADDVVSRYDAFKKCLEERGLDSSDALLDDSFATSDEYMVGLCEAIGSGRLPQALVCGTDQTAFGVIRLLEEAGVRVPDDVIVTGFDGILAGRLMEPQLTTVRQPWRTWGARRLACCFPGTGSLGRRLKDEYSRSASLCAAAADAIKKSKRINHMGVSL